MMTHVPPETVRQPVCSIPVALSTRFLEHFSEQLYSSPQKAFEELISNGWDAGANLVDVHVAKDLKEPSATMAVFDDGTSMDLAGLRNLWHIAFSPKEGRTEEHGRPLIGKFGIGKLATYVLANRLTYICRAADGAIRSVTMDYGAVDRHSTQQEAGNDRLINDLSLDVFELSSKDLTETMQSVAGGDEILHLINQEVIDRKVTQDSNHDSSMPDHDEFGGAPSKLERYNSTTWTLVILSDLKDTGRELKIGILRRMLSAALPFSSKMAICVNGKRLRSTKMSVAVSKEWAIGPDLAIDHITINETDNEVKKDGETSDDDSGTSGPKKFRLTTAEAPYPHIDLPEVGHVTGFVRLFDEKISGGKSEQWGVSNGFHVNVLGRIVNQHDPSCGEKNLNHATWVRFRMTVRADGLSKYLTTNREQFKECRGMKIFRAFLRQAFNKARTFYNSDRNVRMPDGGDVLVRSLGVVSLSPLRNVVSEALRTQPAIPGLFDENGIDDRDEKRRLWREETAANIKKALGTITYEKLDEGSFVKFRLRDSSVVVNREHPFVIEHSHSKAEKELMRTVALIALLTDVYALDIGVEASLLESLRCYRDKLMCFRAVQRRESGVHIARLLRKTEHESQNSKLLEKAVSDALRHLGFEVRELGNSGQPDGIALAFPTPTTTTPTAEDPHPPSYSFSFDAKSSSHDIVKTGNVSIDAVVEHRDRHNANHALVIAPEFSKGALTVRCQKHEVTPMRAKDLGRLLEYTVKYGAIPVTIFRKVFDYNDPMRVSDWVDELADTMKGSRKFTIDVFIKSLAELKGKVPDKISASTVALTCRETLKVTEVLESDVISLAKGLQVIVPDLIGIDNDKIVVNASASHVAAAIKSQLESLYRDDDDG